jgi:hypothetical protein
MCKLTKIWAHQKLLPSQTEMQEMCRRPFDKPVPLKIKIKWCPMCLLWWKSSCELQGLYGLQGPTNENIPTSPFETIHSSCTNQTNISHSTRSNICSNNQTKFLCCTTNIEQDQHKSISSGNQWYTRLKKYDEKPFRASGNYAKPPHNRAY